MISLYDIHLQYILKSFMYFFCGLPLCLDTSTPEFVGPWQDLGSAKVSWSSARDLLACQWKSESSAGLILQKNSSLSFYAHTIHGTGIFTSIHHRKQSNVGK